MNKWQKLLIGSLLVLSNCVSAQWAEVTGAGCWLLLWWKYWVWILLGTDIQRIILKVCSFSPLLENSNSTAFIIEWDKEVHAADYK